MQIETYFDLTSYNSYRIKAVCAKAIFPETEDDIKKIYESAEPKILLGGGYNVILSKPFYEETFVIFDKHFSSTKVSDTIIEAESGSDMLKLSEVASDHSLSGLEIFYDIPSSLGGAVVMNAGAGGEDIKALLLKVRYFDPVDGGFFEKPIEDIDFEYRNSFFQKNPHLIIVKATLKLKLGEKEAIINKMQLTKQNRWAKQPRDYPNGGSVFKRPSGYFVGPLIEGLGLKGLKAGGAMISEKHAGFIINVSGATGQDILQLIKIIKEKVKDNYGVDLEIEQRII